MAEATAGVDIKISADGQKKDEQTKAAPQEALPPIEISGDPGGGPYNIYGSGFGETEGLLQIGSRVVDTLYWTDEKIKGMMPAGVSGHIVLTLADGTVRHGVFPMPTKKA